jgi:hypothetical protein
VSRRCRPASPSRLEIAARPYGRNQEELWRGTYDGVLTNALAYPGLALAWLRFKPPHAWAAWTAAHGESFEPYRFDADFQAILRRMNLEFRPGSPAPVPLPVVPPALEGDGVT